MKTLIVPCAGAGSRLVRPNENPKPLSVFKGETILSYILVKLEPLVDEIVLVISPEFQREFEKSIAETLDPKCSKKIVFAFQEKPLGSHDAVSRGIQISRGDSIAVVWGDQVGVSEVTIREGFEELMFNDIVIPVQFTSRPYVWLEHDLNVVQQVRRSRDGDSVPEMGWADVGAFIFSSLVGAEIISSSKNFQPSARELDFTYLIPQLTHNFKSFLMEREDPLELLSVNTNYQLKDAEWRLP
jgi:dTDP-glucose pyrophosphorylase